MKTFRDYISMVTEGSTWDSIPKDDSEVAKLVAHKLGAYPDIRPDNIQQLVMRMLAMLGHKPQNLDQFVSDVYALLKNEGKVNEETDVEYLDKREADYFAAATSPMKGTYVLYGRKFSTYVFTDEQSANDFMSENSGYGVLAVTPEGEIHVAAMDDEGSIDETFEAENVEVAVDPVKEIFGDLRYEQTAGGEYRSITSGSAVEKSIKVKQLMNQLGYKKIRQGREFYQSFASYQGPLGRVHWSLDEHDNMFTLILTPTNSGAKRIAQLAGLQ